MFYRCKRCHDTLGFGLCLFFRARLGSQAWVPWPQVCPESTLPLTCIPQLLFAVFQLTLDPSFPGWLHKEVKNSPKMSSLKLKKRWFVLTHNSLDYYKSSEKNALKLGTLVLNSLCSVVPPDEKIFKETGTKGLGLKHFEAQNEGWQISEARLAPVRE